MNPYTPRTESLSNNIFDSNLIPQVNSLRHVRGSRIVHLCTILMNYSE